MYAMIIYEWECMHRMHIMAFAKKNRQAKKKKNFAIILLHNASIFDSINKKQIKLLNKCRIYLMFIILFYACRCVCVCCSFSVLFCKLKRKCIQIPYSWIINNKKGEMQRTEKRNKFLNALMIQKCI